MGRDKKQGLILDRLAILISQKDYSKALDLVREINQEDFIKNLSLENARKLFCFIQEIERKLSKKKEELKKAISDTSKVKSAYLGK